MDAKLKETILNPIFKGNPITVLVLGICSSLAVTVTMKGALVMALSVIAVTGISSLILSLLRNTIPSRVRIIVQLVVVANGAGYGMILLIVAFFRELLGSGTLFGIDILNWLGYVPNNLVILPPFALILLGCIVWVQRSIQKDLQEK